MVFIHLFLIEKKNNISSFVLKNNQRKKIFRSNTERKKFMNIIKNQIEESKKKKLKHLIIKLNKNI